VTERIARAVRRILITGIGGSGGSYLAEYIVEHHPDVEVHGIVRWHNVAQRNLARIAEAVTVHEADLTDFGSTFAALQAVQPDAIFHMAAHANVRASFVTPNRVLTDNILGTSTLFEAIRLAKLDPLIQLCSTSEVYGNVRAEDVPIGEEAPLRPSSPYAVSKTAQDLLGWTYFVSYGMRIIRTRMFAYLNPRRLDLFATSFARQVARVERGLQHEIRHGNLDSVRTLIDVRDAMRAFWEGLLYCEPGQAYNVGGTTPVTVAEVLERLIALAGRPIPTRLDARLLRPSDISMQVPSVDKFVQATGWKPTYTVEESLSYLLDYWRRQVEREEAGLS
jgi:GDP-mannose 4,6-dehydratase